MQGDLVRATHPYAFRSGEWAQIVGVDESQYERPCFLVVFPDGATDSWACVDPLAGYEFERLAA